VPVHNIDASVTPPPSSYVPGSTPTTEIQDDTGNAGFPGFNGMEANNALGYTAAAQEAGIPVTYTYLSDVHDDQYNQNGGNAYGPGQPGYEAQLKEYNAAFTAFFSRLANDGINKSNTLFLVTVDEGDHFAGDDLFFQDYCVSGATSGPDCYKQDPEYDWNHGDDQSVIASTWQGWVGPGVAHLGVDSRVWTDHTDAEPTLMTLTGLKSDYLSDGRPISQIIDERATPRAIAHNERIYDALSSVYKQLNAPFGEFGQDALNVSTKAVTEPTSEPQCPTCSGVRRCCATSWS
jgi:hypothetical protein